MKEVTIKCDRCGRSYKLDEFPLVNILGQGRTLRLYTDVDGHSHPIDLCVTCRKALAEWWDNVKLEVK